MNEEKKSFLYIIKNISDYLPSVSKPLNHVKFSTKLMWLLIVLIAYCLLLNTNIYGLDKTKTLDLFAQYRAVMAGSSGSLLQLGISPIITSSIILQLFVGAKIINLDLQNEEDKECYQSISKLFVLLLIIFESIPQVFGFLTPSETFTQTVGPFFSKFIIIFQLFIGSYLTFFLDDVISKWALGSGTSFFILIGVSQSLFTGLFNWSTLSSLDPVSFENLPAGTIPKSSYILYSLSSKKMVEDGYWSMLFHEPNSLFSFISTILIFLLSAFLESSRYELPISHSSIKGARGKYPIKLLYASNIPVILMSTLLANFSMISLLLYTSPSIPLIGANKYIGFFAPNQTKASGGLSWYLSAPSGLSSWLLPMFDSSLDPEHSFFQHLSHIFVYSSVMVSGSILFANYWIDTTNMGSKDLALKIQSNKMQVPGFRSDSNTLSSFLDSFIPPITFLSGFIVGILATFADLLGTVGNASGTGVLLSVGILLQLYEKVGKEQAMEMNPFLRDIFLNTS